MMPVRPVHVAVSDLFLRRRADGRYLAGKIEGPSRQWMVAVEHHFVFGDVRHRVDPDLPGLAALTLELHADGHVLGKLVDRLHLHELGVVVAEGVFGLQPDLARVARLLAGKHALDRLENSLVTPVEILDRLLGLLDQITIRAVELVGEPYYGVFPYFHLPPRFMRSRTSAAWPRGLTP